MGVVQRLRELVIGEERNAVPTITTFDQYVSWMTSGNVRFPVQQTLTGTTETIDGSFGGYASSAYAGNGIVFACMQARFMLFSEARFQFRQIRSGRPGDLFGTSALAPLEAPWPGGTTGDMLTRLLVSADLAGNGFVVKTPAGGLRVLRPDWVTMVLGSRTDPATTAADVDAELVALLHHPGGKVAGAEPDVFVRGEFAHFAPIPDPHSPFRGMSWLTPIVREIRGDTGYTAYKLKFLENGATPNMVITFSPNVDTPEAFEHWVAAMEKKSKGMANAYRTMYLAGGTEHDVVGASMQGMDFKSVQGAGETRIAAAAGVPPVVVGFSEGLQGSSLNAGNYSAARRRFADLTMRPLWRNASGSLASLIAVPDGSELWYDDRDISFLQEDVMDAAAIQEKEALTIRQLVDAGFDPDTVVEAVTAGDLRRLQGKHSGLYSVQLQEPGATDKPDAEPEEPARALSAMLAPYLALRDSTRPAETPDIHVHQPDLVRLMSGLDAFVQNVEERALATEHRAAEAIEASTRALEAIAAREMPTVNVTMPEQPAPVVNFTAGEVRVDVPQQAPALVTVNVPAETVTHIASMPPMDAKVERDTKGKATGIKSR